jgi:hypothetical protein
MTEPSRGMTADERVAELERRLNDIENNTPDRAAQRKVDELYWKPLHDRLRKRQVAA